MGDRRDEAQQELEAATSRAARTTKVADAARAKCSAEAERARVAREKEAQVKACPKAPGPLHRLMKPDPSPKPQA